MKYFLIAMLWVSPVWAAEDNPNWYIKYCKKEVEFEKTQDWNKLSRCTSKFVIERENAQLKELHDFVRANPRYRFPGQSLNRCFGKPREMPFERSVVTANKDGWSASVWYKDKISANCFQSKSWDNRDD